MTEDDWIHLAIGTLFAAGVLCWILAFVLS